MSKKVGAFLFLIYLLWCWIVYNHAREYMFTTWRIYDWILVFIAPLVLLGIALKLAKEQSSE